MKMLALAIALCALSGCALTQRLQTGGSTGPGYKTVSTKVAPATLVALDGSECRVTVDRFERVAVGERVWCYWLARGGVGGPPGPDDPSGVRSGIELRGHGSHRHRHRHTHRG